MVHREAAQCRAPFGWNGIWHLVIVALSFVFGAVVVCGQAISAHAVTAHWIAPVGTPANGPGVYSFRKIFSLNAVPKNYLVHVSADNRFIFYVNGKRMG